MIYRDRLSKINDSTKTESATFNQRKALFNMLQALKRDVRCVHNLSKFEASRLLDELKKEIDENGFPERDENISKYQPDFDGSY
jgi:hypothetical protein